MSLVRLVVYFFVFIFFVSSAFYKFSESFFSLSFIYVFPIILLFLVFSTNRVDRSIFCLLLMLLFLFFLKVVNFFYFGGSDFFVLIAPLNLVVAYALSLSLSWFPLITIRSISIFSIFLTLYCIYLLEYVGVSENDLLVSSRNHISIMVGALWAIVYILNVELRSNGGNGAGKINSILLLILSTISFYLVFLYTGRTGLMVSAVILFCTIYNLFNATKGLQSKILFLSIFLLLFLYVILNLSLIFEFILNSGSLSRVLDRGIADVRWLILTYVLDTTGFENIIFGFPLGYIEDAFGLTAHNSFMQVYLATGFWGLLVLIWFFLWSLFVILKLKLWDYSLIFFLGFIQSFFDTGTFFSPFTGVYISLIFVVLQRRKSMSTRFQSISSG